MGRPNLLKFHLCYSFLEDGRIFAIYSDLDRTAGLVEIDSIDKKITVYL